MIFKQAIIAFCGVLLCSAPVKAEQVNKCKQIIYSGKFKDNDNDLLICLISDNELKISYKGVNGLTEVIFDKSSSSWSKVIEDSAVSDNPYRIINTTFIVQGEGNIFILESSAVGLENNTTDATIKIQIPNNKEEVLVINPYTVINGIGYRLKKEYDIPGGIYFKKERVK